ncbi:uncharacterized protein BP01DRAFT_206213 [Aspergillus saccharolyticus JOP 1030-1]|uniref:Hydrophobin n=1 Tax=Aspergillus saccharolyticus JOP 1030-1 TaxID=1450539 RepID=A0A318YZZ9_9EURO|nr:hypothetical protein BP01DRAFT_206213 [Aspergillus saccharolyticus JOP 1030-1]PYH40591.1 hypothetical protein BP01DRAFT_206213 [Aspergillus saccharolyticus JOP 1030-1]
MNLICLITLLSICGLSETSLCYIQHLGAVAISIAEVHQRQAVSCPSGHIAKCCPFLVPTNVLGTQLTGNVACSLLLAARILRSAF